MRGLDVPSWLEKGPELAFRLASAGEGQGEGEGAIEGPVLGEMRPQDWRRLQLALRLRRALSPLMPLIWGSSSSSSVASSGGGGGGGAGGGEAGEAEAAAAAETGAEAPQALEAAWTNAVRIEDKIQSTVTYFALPAPVPNHPHLFLGSVESHVNRLN